MKNKKLVFLSIAICLAVIMLSSTIFASADAIPGSIPAVAAPAGTIPSGNGYGTGYGNLLQYEWTQSDSGPDFTRFSAGPAPSSPDVLWKVKGISQSANYPAAFNGLVIVKQAIGQPSTPGLPPPPSFKTVVAYDAFTGQLKWNTSIPLAIVPSLPSGSGTYKVDDTHMVVGPYCLDIATGAILWTAPNATATTPFFNPSHGWGSGSIYVPELKMFFTGTQGWNASDISKPPVLQWNLAGKYPDTPGAPIYGDGIIASGVSQGHYYGFNAITGALVWDTETMGEMGYGGSFYNHMFIRGGTTDNTMYAFDSMTGKIKWQYNPGTDYGFWGSGTAIGYGMVYEVNNDNVFYAINADTGKLVWKYEGPGIYYQGYATIADGKVYVTTGQYNSIDRNTGALSNISQYTCFDAFTGQILWQLPYEFRAFEESVAIAYGNLYVMPTNNRFTNPATGVRVVDELWCISSPQSAQMFRKDADHTAQFQAGPSNLNLIWSFQTQGSVVASLAADNGRIFVGSQDKTLYCIDAHAGTQIWSAAIGARIRNTPAVVNGKVYLGPDDGYVYCFDEKNGNQLWKSPAGGQIFNIGADTNPVRSSPTVVNGKVYVGSMDNNTYCFDANTGVLQWSQPLAGPIFSTPQVSNGAVYITCKVATGPGYIYKLNADTGAVMQKYNVTLGASAGTAGNMCASPTVVNGVIYYPGQNTNWYAINEATGATIWAHRYETNFAAVNTGTMAYYGGMVFFSDRFFLAGVNATTGKTMWMSYSNREITSSPAIAVDGMGVAKVYYGTDARLYYALNATNGAKLGFFEGWGNGWSSPVIYDGHMYVGNTDNKVYCLGDYAFQVAHTVAPVVTPTVAPTVAPTIAPTTVPTATVAPSQSTPTPTANTSNDSSTLYIAVAAVVILAIIAVAVLVLRKKK